MLPFYLPAVSGPGSVKTGHSPPPHVISHPHPTPMPNYNANNITRRCLPIIKAAARAHPNPYSLTPKKISPTTLAAYLRTSYRLLRLRPDFAQELGLAHCTEHLTTATISHILDRIVISPPGLAELSFDQHSASPRSLTIDPSNLTDELILALLQLLNAEIINIPLVVYSPPPDLHPRILAIRSEHSLENTAINLEDDKLQLM